VINEGEYGIVPAMLLGMDRISPLLFMAGLGMAVGCGMGEIDGPGDFDPVEEGPIDDEGITTPPTTGPIPTNGLELDNQALLGLDTAPLVDAWADELAATEAGYDLLKYIAICALPYDQELFEHRGYYGLAPEWMDESCDEGCQNWVSACVLAHVNANGAPTEVALAGPHKNFPPVPDNFYHREAAFYGNLFADTVEEMPMFVCEASGFIDASAFLAFQILNGRLCGVSSRCGLQSSGVCLPGSTRRSGACETQPGGDQAGFSDCHLADDREAAPRVSPTTAEVVTVYIHL
jgi:hypothetical protein